MAEEETPEALPTHTPPEAAGSIQDKDTDLGPLLDAETLAEWRERNDGIEVIGDTPQAVGMSALDPVTQKDLDEKTKAQVVEELPVAGWADMQTMPVPPPDPRMTTGLSVFACPQHPYLILMDPNPPHDVIAKFEHGYLATDNGAVIKLLSRTPYVKRVVVD